MLTADTTLYPNEMTAVAKDTLCLTACPVESTRHPRRSRGKRQTADNRLYESRIARLCWLGALWTLDFECNKAIFHWLHKAEPYRG